MLTAETSPVLYDVVMDTVMFTNVVNVTWSDNYTVLEFDTTEDTEIVIGKFRGPRGRYRHVVRNVEGIGVSISKVKSGGEIDSTDN